MSELTRSYLSESVIAKAQARGMRIEVEADDYPTNPRSEDYQELSSTLVTGGRCTLGDKHMSERFSSIEEAVASFSKKEGVPKDDMLWWPVFKYEHGGVALALGAFSCPFDSGVCGFIYESKEAIRAEFGVKRISSKLMKKIENRVKGELAELEAYANGDVYEVLVYDGDDDVINSCGGVYGADSKQLEGLANELLNEYQCA